MDKRPEIDAEEAIKELIRVFARHSRKFGDSIEQDLALNYAISCIQQVRDMKKKPVVDHDGGVML